MTLPYPAYRDSEIPWIGEIPAHWRTVSLKWVSKRYSGGTPDKTRLDYWEEGTIPWLNSGTVNEQKITTPSAFITDEAFQNSSAKWIPSGALVMALAGQGKTKGMVAQVMFESTCNQSMAAIIPRSECKVGYLLWWLTSNYQNIRNMAGGDLRDGLNLDLLGSIPCPLPEADEQFAIANFLDRETAKIDALIAEQEKLLALLAEKRQAIISQAVTRGLNPDAPMKDFGIPWLGEMPAHWEVVPLMRLVDPKRPIMYGIVLPGPNVENGVPIVKGGDVKTHRLKLELLNRTTEEIETPYARARLKPTDLVYSIRGTIGDAEIVPNELRGANITQDVARIAPAYGIQTRWLLYAMKSKPVFVQLELRSLGAAVKGINIYELNRARIPVPPISERGIIASFLDAELSKMDDLVDQSKKVVKLLKERRSALIAAAVTGKIDLRNSVQLEVEVA